MLIRALLASAAIGVVAFAQAASALSAGDPLPLDGRKRPRAAYVGDGPAELLAAGTLPLFDDGAELGSAAMKIRLLAREAGATPGEPRVSRRESVSNGVRAEDEPAASAAGTPARCTTQPAGGKPRRAAGKGRVAAARARTKQ